MLNSFCFEVKSDVNVMVAQPTGAAQRRMSGQNRRFSPGSERQIFATKVSCCHSPLFQDSITVVLDPKRPT
jgi:hypothetical protein